MTLFDMAGYVAAGLVIAAFCVKEMELAAARAKMLSVQKIRARLKDRFRLLTGSGRNAVGRQQTLPAAILAVLGEPVLRPFAVKAGIP